MNASIIWIWAALVVSVLFDISFGILTKYSTSNAHAGALAWWARLVKAVYTGIVLLFARKFPGGRVWLLGAVSALFLLLGEYFRWRSMQKGSDTACTLAVVELYPILAGVLVLFWPAFGANPTGKDIAAFALVLAALLIANWPRGGQVTKEVFLGLLFMTIEISVTLYGRIVMKIPTTELIFAISVTGMVWFLPMVPKIDVRAAKWGTITSLVNLATIIPFLWTMGAAPASSKPVMLAVTSLSSTLGAIAANIWFKEQWSTKKILLIAFLGIASVLTI